MHRSYQKAIAYVCSAWNVCPSGWWWHSSWVQCNAVLQMCSGAMWVCLSHSDNVFMPHLQSCQKGGIDTRCHQEACWMRSQHVHLQQCTLSCWFSQCRSVWHTQCCAHEKEKSVFQVFSCVFTQIRTAAAYGHSSDASTTSVWEMYESVLSCARLEGTCQYGSCWKAICLCSVWIHWEIRKSSEAAWSGPRPSQVELHKMFCAFSLAIAVGCAHMWVMFAGQWLCMFCMLLCYWSKNGASLLLHSYPRAFLTVYFMSPAHWFFCCMLILYFRCPDFWLETH